MLLLSRIVSWGSTGLVGEVDIRDDSLLVESGRGVPRWIALEYMAQAVGALDGIRLRESDQGVPPGYLLGTRFLDQTDGYFPTGTTLRITVDEVLQGGNGLAIYSCRLDDGSRPLICQLAVYRPPGTALESGV